MIQRKIFCVSKHIEDGQALLLSVEENGTCRNVDKVTQLKEVYFCGAFGRTIRMSTSSHTT